MPTRTFEIARSKPKLIRMKNINDVFVRTYVVEKKITHEEWVEFVDNNNDLEWGKGDETRKMIAFYKPIYEGEKIFSDWQISESSHGDLDVIMWKKNQESVKFIYKIAEHFDAELYNFIKEYVLK
jgi:hypothetical protein